MTRPFHPSRRSQRGVSLVFSLITLVALSLAAVALIRSVDTGATILGNLSFKQDTLLAADEASRRAISWLDVNRGGNTLNTSIEAQGYRAMTVDRLDATGTRSGDNTRAVVDWNMNDCSDHPSTSYASCIKPLANALSLGPNDVQARWLIVRVCSAEGDPPSPGVAFPRPSPPHSQSRIQRRAWRPPAPRRRATPTRR